MKDIIKCKCWNKSFSQNSPATIISTIQEDEINWLWKNWVIADWPMWSKTTLWRCSECGTKYPDQDFIENLHISIS